jgi:erythromycin esterase-like protein
MSARPDRETVERVRGAARVLSGGPADFDPLMERIGDARYVLLGEASHGTHEFYRIRAEITKRLIVEKGFRAVAVEADWPDAAEVNRYLRGRPGADDASEALAAFQRFPQWMWRNADVLDFVGWARTFNESRRGEHEQVGFYGLDLYSLHRSMAAVLQYLRHVDPAAARRAEHRYACFDQFGEEPQSYGYATALGLAQSCETAVVWQLQELRAASAEYAMRDGQLAADAHFMAAQNARVVANAEEYYRQMFVGRVSSWNLRDTHMAETLTELNNFLAVQGSPPRIVVWAHNSHLGDARATEMGRRGEHNVGQLVRERVGAAAVNVGFTTYDGTVTAASDWDGGAERKLVRPALPGSYEALFHETGLGNFYLDLGVRAPAALAVPRLERAIGVVYRPETERQSHYFEASLARQFDAVFHYDRTRAVEPLERTPSWDRVSADFPETFPSAL